MQTSTVNGRPVIFRGTHWAYADSGEHLPQYDRGHPVRWDAQAGFVYLDTGDPVAGNPRPCPRCGQYPTPEGYDACLGCIPGACSACCGHGVQEPYIIYERWRYMTNNVRIETGRAIFEFGEMGCKVVVTDPAFVYGSKPGNRYLFRYRDVSLIAAYQEDTMPDLQLEVFLDGRSPFLSPLRPGKGSNRVLDELESRIGFLQE